MRIRVRTTLLVASLAAGTVIAACSDSTTTPAVTPQVSPLAGLVKGATNDSNASPPANQPATPGSFHGTVMGHADFPPGTDTLQALPRIVGATLVAYNQVAPTPSNTSGVGSMVASVTTDANGQFQFPGLPGGSYVVTITPPAGSKYQGVWVTPIASAHSSDYPWWVVLPLK